MKKRTHNIRQVKDDYRNDFGSFYETYYERFKRFAYYYLNDWEIAKDITHDSILYYWENRDTISPDADILGYILMTVKNKCLNHLKHLKVETEYAAKQSRLYQWEIESRLTTLEDESYSTIFTREMIDIITDSLSKLPSQTREIFIQHRLRNKSRKEIAAKMKVSVQKIDYHIKKANHHLTNVLREYLPLILLILLKIT